MNRPRILDLFCGAGGAAMGYHQAGFHVTGVDINPQPHYCGDEFHQADALTFPLDGYDVIHASPPCQRYSRLGSLHPNAEHPDLLGPTLQRLQSTGLPFVLENVVGAPFPPELYRIMLCGSSFGMRIQRHRWFASNVALLSVACDHASQAGRLLGVYGASDGAHPDGFKHPGQKRGPRQATTAEAREVMGMPWAVQRRELTEAIPPAFTRFIGGYLFDHLMKLGSGAKVPVLSTGRHDGNAAFASDVRDTVQLTSTPAIGAGDAGFKSSPADHSDLAPTGM